MYKSKLNILAILVFLLLIPGYLFAQDGTLRGRIVDGKTDEPITGVTVTLQGTSFTAATDLDGSYSFINVPPITYTVQITLTGYSGLTYTNVPIYSGQTTTQNFVIAESPAQVYTVTNTNSSGTGSLKQAIIDANSNTDYKDVIRFNIPGSGPYIIQPTETDLLPTITDPVIIDGTTQFSVSGFPIVEIDGSASPDAPGFSIEAGGTTIKGFVINNFTNSFGIWIYANGGNTIQNNYIGTDATGTTVASNHTGIEIDNSPNNTIGGTGANDPNIISGNSVRGINIINTGSSGNKVLGNFIGTNHNGDDDIGNQHGVWLWNAPNNIIGGETEAERNIISGNTGNGIWIDSDQCNGNSVIGNYIGLAPDGVTSLGNNAFGVKIRSAYRNIVEDNVVSANGSIDPPRHGIHIEYCDPPSLNDGNTVRGNYVGTDATGMLDRGNVNFGIMVFFSDYTTIVGNVVADNRYGVVLWGNDVEGSSDNNIIRNNLIGTKQNGTEKLGNEIGLYIRYSHNNTVGGTAVGDRNIISGNTHWGLVIGRGSSSGNHVYGNYIGINSNGDALGNGYDHPTTEGAGLYIFDATENHIGGVNPGEVNVISGNIGYGIVIERDTETTTNNYIRGNFIGTNADGSAAIGNTRDGIYIQQGSSNIIGGGSEGEGNVISGNGSKGIYISGENSTGNIIAGNMIGTNSQGLGAIPNVFGIIIDGSPNNTIGGASTGERNIISGNSDDGINILGSLAENNVVMGNFVGLAADGSTVLGNGDDGVNIVSPNNTIGGTNQNERNVISGNSHGITIISSDATGNKVIGNYIGTDSTGMVTDPDGTPGNGDELGNGAGGIFIADGAQSNIIGPDNLISGNIGNGVHIADPLSINNIIIGNLIGTNAPGTDILGNSNSGVVLNSPNNRIGGTNEEERNILSGNDLGLVIQGSDANDNHILGNYIGTDITGSKALGNSEHGIFLGDGTNNTIGPNNLISGNDIFGVLLTDDAHDNYVQGNRIGTNVAGTDTVPNFIGVNILQAQNNTIGGTNSGDGNLISGNRNEGILIYGNTTSPSDGNIVQGNYIGTANNGVQPLGNETNGIRFGNHASNNLIGGMDPEAANVIAFNGSFGIACGGAFNPDTGNAVLSNSIHSNGVLAIDLNSDGVTGNDVGDSDTGPNNFQNFPVLHSVNFSGGNVTIDGSLNSLANTTFFIQFFANQLADGSGYGEGRTFLGTDTITTDGSGDVNFNATFPTRISNGQVITATATDTGSYNTSEFSKAIGGPKSQTLAVGNMPLHYWINQNGNPNITDGSDTVAIDNAFQHWADISTSTISFVDEGTTTQKYAGNDGVNLVTFTDDQFPLPRGVLAVAAKTIEIGENEETARIIDADIVFNPYYVDHPDYNFGTDSYAGYFDIESVATHEIGHVLGLVHSGIVDATMFFYLQRETEARSLETDDIAWASYRYPDGSYSSTFGSIAGNIADGYGTGPVAGTLIIAENETTGDSVHTYSDEYGNYSVPGLQSGNYKVSIQPLDGDVGGYPMTPAHVSSYIYAITSITDFPDEYYNSTDESENPNTDIAESFSLVSVGAGVETGGTDLITNLDLTPPEIVRVSPKDGDTDISVLTPIVVVFSEPIDRNTFNESTFTLDTLNSTSPVAGNFQVKKDTLGVFYPANPLDYSTAYSIAIDGVQDKKGNVLQTAWSSSFTTEAPDTDSPAITQIVPEDGSTGVFITSKVWVTFSEPIQPNSLTENSFTVSTGGQNLLGTLTLSADYTIATFSPSTSLLEGTTYTVTVTTDITDLYGNALSSPFSSTFTTVAQAAPVVTYLGPEDGATGISVTTPILADFSEPIDVNTIDASTFMLEDGSGQPVAGTYDFLLNNARVVFRPNADLTFNSQYSVTLTTGITDVSQPPQPFASDTVSTFTTASQATAPLITFITPPSANPGTEVVIGGEGFDPVPTNNQVLFGDSSATVTRADLYSITTEVPQNLASGSVKVKVTVNGIQSNEFDFYVAPQVEDPLNQVIAEVDADSKTHDGDITPDGSYAYITNAGSNTVSVININNATNVGTIPVGNTPLKIAINPQGTRAYVTNFASNTVSVIDIIQNKVIKTIPVGIHPIGVAVTPDGGRVYVAHYTSEDLLVIDTDENSGSYNHVVGRVDTDSENRDLDISPDGTLAYVTGSVGLIIVEIDPASSSYNHVVGEVDTDSGTRNIEISPDGTLAVVTTDDGNILVIDVLPQSSSYGQVVAEVDSDSESRDLDISPDGLWIYVTDYDANTVSVYEFVYGFGASPMAVGASITGKDSPLSTEISLKLVDTIPVGQNPEGIVIDARGQRAVTANSGSDNVTIINLTLPIVNEIVAPVDPVEVGTKISVSAEIPYASQSNPYDAVWDWGDGSTSEATIDNYVLIIGKHIYNTPGVYIVTLQVTDTYEKTAMTTYEFIVVYDPEGGFVTGGGWINSPEGAYTADPSLTGKANFGFVSKYKKGANVPTGNTEFQFKAANLKFKSTSYEWLVIAGARAQYKGEGTINHTGSYGFMLTAIDGQIDGGGDVDKFRIKIWEKNEEEAIVYDNQPGDPDDADASTVLGGGSITIHDSKGRKKDQHGSNNETLDNTEIPKTYALNQNYPNPFNPSTNITFDVPEYEDKGVHVELKIFNILGQFVATLVNEQKQPGRYSVIWNGRYDDGREAPNGIYIFKMTARDFQQVRKMIFMR